MRRGSNIDAKERFSPKQEVVSRRCTRKSNQHIGVPIQLPLTPCGATDTSCLRGSNSRTPAVKLLASTKYEVLSSLINL